jgi:hypothetical protein
LQKDDFPGLRTLEQAVRQSRVTNRAPLYSGSYGSNPDAAKALSTLGAFYAPLFSIQPGKTKPGVPYVPALSYRERGAGAMLSPDELAELNPIRHASRLSPRVSRSQVPTMRPGDWSWAADSATESATRATAE